MILDILKLQCYNVVMGTINNIWQKEEVELLTSIFATHGIKESAKILNRTESSTAKKANRLGLKSRAHFMTHEQYENKLCDREIDIEPIEQYINTRTPILHKCLLNHTWKAEPHDILKGNGCPKCSKYSFKLDKPARVYYLRIEYKDEKYYKIGVTAQSISKRFQFDTEKQIAILQITEYETGLLALTEEKRILNLFKDKRIYRPGFLKSNGNTELFEEDVLNLDT